MCKFNSFHFAFAPARLTALFLFSFSFSYNVHGLILKKVFVLNKNIVHLINDIFWNMGFKMETQADKVIHIIPIVRIISIISIIRDIN